MNKINDKSGTQFDYDPSRDYWAESQRSQYLRKLVKYRKFGIGGGTRVIPIEDYYEFSDSKDRTLGTITIDFSDKYWDDIRGLDKAGVLHDEIVRIANGGNEKSNLLRSSFGALCKIFRLRSQSAIKA